MLRLISSIVLSRFLEEKESYRLQCEELEAERQRLLSLNGKDYSDPKVQHTKTTSRPESYVVKLSERAEELQEAHRRLRSVQKATKLLIYGVSDKTARKALVCLYMKGMTWAECAAELATTEGALRKRIYRNAMPEVDEEIRGMKDLLSDVKGW